MGWIDSMSAAYQHYWIMAFCIFFSTLDNLLYLNFSKTIQYHSLDCEVFLSLCFLYQHNPSESNKLEENRKYQPINNISDSRTVRELNGYPSAKYMQHPIFFWFMYQRCSYSNSWELPFLRIICRDTKLLMHSYC